jgi:hypothetical protein
VYSSDDIKFDVLNLSSIQNISVLYATDDELYCLIKDNFSNDDLEKIKTSNLSQEDKEKLSERSFEDNPILLRLKN